MELRFKEEKWLPKITLLGGGKAGTRLTDAQMPSPPTTCTQTPGLSLEPASTLNKLPGPEVTCPAASVSHLPQSFCLPSTLSHFFFLILASFQFSQHLVNYSSMFSSTALSSLASASAVLSGGERRKEGGGERRQLWPLGAPVAGSALPHTGWGAGAICLNSLCFSLLHFKIRGMN